MNVGNQLLSDQRKATLQDITLLFAFTLLVFWKLILTGQYTILWAGDTAIESYPWYQFLSWSLHHHSFPFWNPYSEAGRLFIGEPSTGAFYPLNLLISLLPLNSRGLLPAWAIEYFVVLHYFIAALLTYFLCRELRLRRPAAIISGIAFAYSGSLSFRSYAHISIFAAFVWIPGVFLVFLKALRSLTVRQQLLWANLGGLALAFILMAGHHQPFLDCSLALAVTAIVMCVSSSMSLCESGCPDRLVVLRVLFLLFVFSVMYCCVQLVPTLQYSHDVYRWVGEPAPIVGSKAVPYPTAGRMYALRPQNILMLVFPFFVGAEANPYLGAVPLCLLLFSVPELKRSRVVRLMWLLAIVFILIAFGDYTPIHGLIYHLLPGYGTAREPVRSIVIMHCCFSILAGYGLESLLLHFSREEKALRTRLAQAFSAFSALIILSVCGVYLYSTQVLGKNFPDSEALIFTSLLLLLTSAIVLTRVYGVVNIKIVNAALIILMLLDYHAVLRITIRPKRDFSITNRNLEPSQWYRPDEVVEFLAKQTEPSRAYFVGKEYSDNIGDVHHIETVNGYGASELLWFADLMAIDAQRSCSLLNVRYVVSTATLPLREILRSQESRLYEKACWFPRAWLVPVVVPKGSDAEVLSAVKDGSVDLRQVAVMRGPLDKSLSQMVWNHDAANTGPQLQVKSETQWRSPNSFSVEVQVSQPVMLVVSEMWYPGWRAAVAGARRPVWRVDYGLMGVYLEPGDQRVDFRFTPPHFYLELIVTLSAALVLGILFIEKGWRRYKTLPVSVPVSQ